MELCEDDLRLLGDLPRPCKCRMRALRATVKDGYEHRDSLELENAIARAAHADRLEVRGTVAEINRLTFAAILSASGQDAIVETDLFYGHSDFSARLTTFDCGSCEGASTRRAVRLVFAPPPEFASRIWRSYLYSE